MQRGNDNRPWLVRLINPGVPWYVAVVCNILAGTGIVLLALDPASNLPLGLPVICVAAVLLYGTALVRWWIAK